MGLKRIRSATPETNTLQGNIEAALAPLYAALTAGATLSALTPIATTDTKVYHKLGRPIRACIPCLPTASAIFFSGSASASPSQYINVRASTVASAYFLFI